MTFYKIFSPERADRAYLSARLATSRSLASSEFSFGMSIRYISPFIERSRDSVSSSSKSEVSSFTFSINSPYERDDKPSVSTISSGDSFPVRDSERSVSSPYLREAIQSSIIAEMSEFDEAPVMSSSHFSYFLLEKRTRFIVMSDSSPTLFI